MRKFLLACLFVLGLGWALLNFQGLAVRGDFDELVLDFREDIPAEQLQADLDVIANQYNLEARLNSQFSAEDNIYIVKGDKTLLQALKASPLKRDTEYMEPNYIYSILGSPNDPMYEEQWNLSNINIEDAWEESQGEGVTVAVIDTGVSQVKDLKDTKFVPGYDFVNDRDKASDDHGHGTHVAGTVAQSTNNNYGVAGVAYKASIMPLKVLSASGSGTISDIAEAIRFAADNGADVINMSLGGGGASNLMEEAIDYAYEKGVVVVAAAGNENTNSSSYPARYPKVISVSALDIESVKAPYSNYGAGVDISGPGGSKEALVLQETIDPSSGEGVFAGFQGTSMASPHVAGVAALIKAEGITDPAEVLQILQKSAQKVEEDPQNHFGAGKLDAAAAVKLADSGKLCWKNFFRWLQENGYLDLRFWFDGGAIMLLPKLLMVIGAYLLAWYLRYWTWPLSIGLILGSSGLFFFRGLYIYDLPQSPMRLLGSSIPELGNAISGTPELNPLFASVLIPFALVALLASHSTLKWFAIGTSLGVASCLLVSAVFSPAVWGLGAGIFAQAFLVVNALLCIGLGFLASKGERKFA